MADMKRIDLRDTAWRDARGWGINPLEAASLSNDSLGNLHVVSIRPGCIRGDHYHANGTEWIVVFGGRARIVWQSGEEDSVHQAVLNEEDDPALFEIPPGVGHAVMNASKSDIYLISINNSSDPGTVSCRSLFKPDQAESESEDGSE